MRDMKVFWALLVVGVMALPAWATGVTNGDFSTPGLAGWTPTGGVSDGGGYALIQDTDFFNSLEQTLTIPAGATSLSFDFTFTSTGSGVPITDTFTASLLEPAPSFAPIISKSGMDTWYFLRENSGAIDMASAVTLSGNTVTLDLTSLSLPKDVLLAFDLIDGDGTPNTQVTIDNVLTLQPAGPIPEPLTAIGIPLGVALVGSYLRRRAR